MASRYFLEINETCKRALAQNVARDRGPPHPRCPYPGTGFGSKSPCSSCPCGQLCRPLILHAAARPARLDRRCRSRWGTGQLAAEAEAETLSLHSADQLWTHASRAAPVVGAALPPVARR